MTTKNAKVIVLAVVATTVLVVLAVFIVANFHLSPDLSVKNEIVFTQQTDTVTSSKHLRNVALSFLQLDAISTSVRDGIDTFRLVFRYRSEDDKVGRVVLLSSIPFSMEQKIVYPTQLKDSLKVGDVYTIFLSYADADWQQNDTQTYCKELSKITECDRRLGNFGSKHYNLFKIKEFFRKNNTTIFVSQDNFLLWAITKMDYAPL